MTITMLKGKIHRATVTQAELNYVGSITVDADLLDAAGILEYEAVQVVDVNNGNRFMTYTLAGERGSVLTINQGIPLQGVANASISIETADLKIDLEALMDKLRMVDGVKRFEILGQV